MRKVWEEIRKLLEGRFADDRVTRATAAYYDDLSCRDELHTKRSLSPVGGPRL